MPTYKCRIIKKNKIKGIITFKCNIQLYLASMIK